MKDWLGSFQAGAWLIANWQLALGIFGAAALALVGAYFLGRDHGYDLRLAEEAAELAKIKRLEDKSEGLAAGEREVDTDTISENQETRDAAIISANDKDRPPSASRNALNCERLRAAKADLSQFPACRGREGRD